MTPGFIENVARLREFQDGPKRARKLLARRGIARVIVEHLPKTHLGGAALRLGDGRPVIGLTLRYDRIARAGTDSIGDYGSRKAVIGSTRAARVAGTQDARTETAITTRVARANSTTSVGVTP